MCVSRVASKEYPESGSRAAGQSSVVERLGRCTVGSQRQKPVVAVTTHHQQPAKCFPLKYIQLLCQGWQRCQQPATGDCCATATAGLLLGHILKSCRAAVVGEEKKLIDFRRSDSEVSH